MNTSEYFHIIEIINEKENIVDKLIEHAAKIALISFLHRYQVLLLFHISFENHLHKFFDGYGKSVFVYNSYETLKCGVIQQYVILITGIDDATKKLNWLSENSFYNTGRFIIACHPEHLDDCDESKILKLCWEYKIINVLYLKSNKHMDDVKYYTFDPYKDGKCGNSDVILITDRGQNSNIYFPKKCMNLNLCPLIASTYTQMPFMDLTKDGKPYGIDGDVLAMIGNALNASLKVMTPMRGHGWGSREENGTWIGSLGDVFYDYANFSMTSAAISLPRFESFEMSVGYNSVGMLWVTRPNKPRPGWQKILRPFDALTYAYLGFVFLLVFLINLFLKSEIWSRLRSKLFLRSIKQSVIFYSWTLFIGMPMKKLPNVNKSLSMMIVTWLWFSFLVKMIYQAALISALKSTYYYPGVKTLHDATQAGYQYGGGKAIKYYFVDDPIIFNSWVYVDPKDIPDNFKQISNGLKFLTPTSKEIIIQYIKENKLKFHFLKEVMVVSPTVIFFKKYSPFVNPINDILLKLREGGFIEKFYKDYMANKQDKNQHSESIKLKDISGCYVVLLIGYAIATAILIFEMHEYNNWKL